MNREEFIKSITKEEYRDAIKAEKFMNKRKKKFKHEFKVVMSWREARNQTRRELSKKLDEFFLSYIPKKSKKSHYPSDFRKKQKILKKTIGKCLQCGSNKYLQVHHLDKNKFNNDDSNLKLLCYECHKIIHKHLRLPSFLKI